LRGIHTVLSFFVVHLDEGCIAQKSLIQASIAAGVRRFAPSEWGIRNGNGVPSYDNKDTIRGYLETLDSKGELGGMQYCLFQPSIFTGYFAHPYPLERELITWPFFLDFANRRAMILDSGDQPIVLTAVLDNSEILRLSIEDERAWPKVGGIRGCRTSINELLAIGKKVRGGDWSIEHVSSSDLAQGELKTTYVLTFYFTPWTLPTHGIVTLLYRLCDAYPILTSIDVVGDRRSAIPPSQPMSQSRLARNL
jgi:hypothetical protein